MKVYQLVRYLKFFPFLWAIERDWDLRRVTIRVKRASREAIVSQSRDKEDWWLYATAQDGWPVMLGTYSGAATFALSMEMDTMLKPEYLVRRMWVIDRQIGDERWFSEITIFRPPRGQSFGQFFKETA